MKYVFIIGVVSTLIMTACAGKKTEQTPTNAVVKAVLSDSIDRAINEYEQRLDVKMKRKKYEPVPGTLVTLQKWYEFGDTTRLVKLREETLTGDAKMEIAQYHFIGGKLAEIHNYTYNRQCGGNHKQCMDEAKYFFDDEILKLAQKRYAEGNNERPPVIESAYFAPFEPGEQVLAGQQDKLKQINEKYALLPFPKPRPERGTPVPMKH